MSQAVSPREARKRATAVCKRRRMASDLRAAFLDVAMLDHAALVVWTKGQMNGVRAAIKRLGLVR